MILPATPGTSMNFFQYFARIAPRLSKLSGPLRDLTAQHKKFIPTEEHRRGFEEAKKHLLDEKVNCIRTPSSDPSDTLVLWTDASMNSISCLLTQCLEPLTDEFPKKKRLYIIGCFSSVIKPAWRNWPIWLLELISFYEATRKFRTILIGRPFYVITDSRVVTMWTSLDLVPKDLARRILALQKFQYRIIFCESRINPADCISRLGTAGDPGGTYPRFIRARLFNSKGQKIDWESVFSRRKADEAREFFLRNRNQALSRAADDPRDDMYASDDDDEDDLIFGPDHTVEKASTVETPPIQAEDPKTIYAAINAVELTDEERDEGRIEEEDDAGIEPEEALSVKLPNYADAMARAEILEKQIGPTADFIRQIIREEIPLPGKYESQLLSISMRLYLRTKSLFRMNEDGILFRLWTHPDGRVDTLIFLEEEPFAALLEKEHGFLRQSGAFGISHTGRRKTMVALSKVFFAFEMRRKVHDFVNSCSVCRLNTNPVSSA